MGGLCAVSLDVFLWNHDKALHWKTEQEELPGLNHKRHKTRSSPMRKRALGSRDTTERDTTPLKKTAAGTRSLLTSRSDRASETSGGRFSINAPGEVWGVFSLPSWGEADRRAELWLTSVSPVLPGGVSMSPGDGGSWSSAPRGTAGSARRGQHVDVLPARCAADSGRLSDVSSHGWPNATPAVERRDGTPSAGSSGPESPAGCPPDAT